MKALVTYYSESDNTRKVAEALAAGLRTQAVSLSAVDPRTLAGYDLVCIGSPVHAGGPARKVREFISQIPRMDGRKCAAFCTMHAFGDKTTLRSMQTALEAKGMVYLGGCSALGWSRLVANFGPRIFNRGRPNREELATAEALGRKLLEQMGPARAA